MSLVTSNPSVPRGEPIHLVVEVTFPVLGLSLPSNNGYPLLGAIAGLTHHDSETGSYGKFHILSKPRLLPFSVATFR